MPAPHGSTLCAKSSTSGSAKILSRHPSFFLGANGRAIGHGQAAATFRLLRGRLGWHQKPVPRLHDLRHTFACGRLIDWYRQGEELGQKVLSLATYLGHSSIQGTYWYLSAVPELLSLAQTRWAELKPASGGFRD
jgi:integrase